MGATATGAENCCTGAGAAAADGGAQVGCDGGGYDDGLLGAAAGGADAV